MKRTIPALLGLLTLTAATTAPRQTACDTRGWGDAERTVVRAAPSPNARVIVVMRKRHGEDVNGDSPQFDIDAVSNGWFRIRNASYGGYDGPEFERPLFSGRGWVHGSQISGQLCGSTRFYTAPSERARSRPVPAAADAVNIRGLLDCQGSWVKVDSDIGIGWVNAFSNNQVTTCS
jgi:hypothetical protein